jgi:hypothetical protein
MKRLNLLVFTLLALNLFSQTNAGSFTGEILEIDGEFKIEVQNVESPSVSSNYGNAQIEIHYYITDFPDYHNNNWVYLGQATTDTFQIDFPADYGDVLWLMRGVRFSGNFGIITRQTEAVEFSLCSDLSIVAFDTISKEIEIYLPVEVDEEPTSWSQRAEFNYYNSVLDICFESNQSGAIILVNTMGIPIEIRDFKDSKKESIYINVPSGVSEQYFVIIQYSDGGYESRYITVF